MNVETYTTPLAGRKMIGVSLGNTEHGLTVAQARELRDRLTDMLEESRDDRECVTIACSCGRPECRNYIAFDPACASVSISHCPDDGCVVLPRRLFDALYADSTTWLTLEQIRRALTV